MYVCMCFYVCMSNPDWTVRRNARATISKERDTSIVSDLVVCGNWGGKALSLQFDVSNTNTFRHGAFSVRDNMSMNGDGFCFDIMAPLLDREKLKWSKYNDKWAPSNPDDLFVPAVCSSHGAIAPEFLLILYDIASNIINCDSDMIPNHDWDIPSGHILIGLMFQSFRARIARAALSSSLRSLGYLLSNER